MSKTARLKLGPVHPEIISVAQSVALKILRCAKSEDENRCVQLTNPECELLASQLIAIAELTKNHNIADELGIRDEKTLIVFQSVIAGSFLAVESETVQNINLVRMDVPGDA